MKYYVSGLSGFYGFELKFNLIGSVQWILFIFRNMIFLRECNSFLNCNWII